MEEEAAVAILGVAFLVVTGAVLLLRPVALRLGDLLELAIEESRARIRRNPESESGAHLMEPLEERLRRVEDRLEFAEGLLERRHFLAAGPSDANLPPPVGRKDE